MSSRRTLILVGAIAVGAIAAFLIVRYVGGIEDKANADNQMVSVLVVSGDVHKGEAADTALTDGRIVVGNRRRVDVPSNAVTRPEDVKGQLAAIDMAGGEIVTASKFVASNNNLTDSKSNVLDKGEVAITVSFDQTTGVAGLIQPGDFVNMLVKTKPVATATTTPDGAAGAGADDSVGATHLFQKVKVLAVGRDLGTPVAAAPNPDGTPATTAAPSSDLITFEVPPEASAVIAAAAEKGIRLTLVRPDYQPRPLPNVFVGGTQGSFPGESGETPYDGLPSAESGKVGGP